MKLGLSGEIAEAHHRWQFPSLLRAAASPLMTGCDWGAQERTAVMEEPLQSVELAQPSFTASPGLSLASSRPETPALGPRLALSSPSPLPCPKAAFILAH